MARKFPESEQFGLVSQMRRSTVSIPGNIAEGNARKSRKDYLRLLIISRGSLAELETQILIAGELRYLSETAPILSNIAEISRRLRALLDSLKQKGQ